MQVLEPQASGAKPDPAVVAHYNLVAPLMERSFAGIPLVWTAYPKGTDKPADWHVHYFGHYTRVTAAHITALASIGAQEFYSWFPVPGDDRRARYMVFAAAAPKEDFSADRHDRTKRVARLTHDALAEEGRASFALLPGAGGIHVIVPVAGGPSYDDVRVYLNAFVRNLVAKHGDLVSAAPLNVNDGRIHVHVSHNAINLGTSIPYSLRAQTGRVALPIAWDELAGIDLTSLTPAQFAQRLRERGDVLAEEIARCGAGLPLPQTRTAVLAPGTGHNGANGQPGHNAKGQVIAAALSILADGKPRTSNEILQIALERKLVLPTAGKDLHTVLLDLIQRYLMRKRKCPIVEDPDRRFRINEPPDLWPDLPAQPAPPVSAATQTLIDRVRATAVGEDGTAFESAVCDAFAALGFHATHMGGHYEPDGVIDAQLGRLGYRVMVECKTGPSVVQNPRIEEAAKWREAYKGDYCAIVGPGFKEGEDVSDELRVHGVSAWTVDDLVLLLQWNASALEMRPLFEPGYAEDRVHDILWNRRHGQGKRVAIIAEIIRSAGWAAQCASALAADPSQAPLLTEDAAMLLVDQELAAQGAHVNCTREEVRLAFAWLTSPLVGAAVWQSDNTAITITASTK